MHEKAVFGLSVYERSIVIDEGFTTFPIVRVAFIVLTTLLGLVANTYLVWHVFREFRPRQSHNEVTVRHLTLAKLTVGVYLVNQIIHAIHYVDNIARPVAYKEPSWLYRDYVVATMEITFAINWPATIGGTWCVVKMFTLHPDHVAISARCCCWMFLYIGVSLLTVMHYRISPPSSYTAWVNFSIAGEGVCAVILAVLTALCLRCARQDEATISKYKYVPTGDPSLHGEHIEAVDMQRVLDDKGHGVHRRSSTQKIND